MAENGDGHGAPSSSSVLNNMLMDRVFDLADADAADHTLASDNALVRKLLATYFSEGAGSLDSSALVQQACGRVWDRVDAMGCRPPDGWTGTVIMSLFLLAREDRREELSVQLWRVVAHPAEKAHDGFGRLVMRRAAAAVKGQANMSPVLGDFAVATLRRGGHPPPPVAQQRHGQGFCGGEKEEQEEHGGGAAPAPSQYGLRLALFVASRILETSLQADGNDGAAAAWETWRWNVHLEVVRLLRVGRLEDLSELVATIAGPLYRGWGNVHALQDIWSMAASSAAGERAELHLALMCILAQDLRPVLDIPKAFDLIYLGVSGESSLGRRRGLHVLQQILAWADEPSTSTPVGEPEPEPSPPPPPQFRPSDKGLFPREALLQWHDFARCLGVLFEETELHLLDQVVPTVERLCSKLSLPPASGGGGDGASASADAESGASAAPLPTEFRWVAIPLGMLIQSGTFAHRRKLLQRIVRCDLGLGRDAARGTGGGGEKTTPVR